MTRTYAAVSNKGGAGKTTLVTLLGGEYALRGDRVLLIDADNRQNPSIEWKRTPPRWGKLPSRVPKPATSRFWDAVAATKRARQRKFKRTLKNGLPHDRCPLRQKVGEVTIV
jgi:ABC-type branched-subunit amino acid transport system ATPase component